ncbi:HAMP domain-containing sensor histidine kinase [Streptomyces sp. NPDC097619]|uniref:sensor histidine kinase n=1 Tax=Streptomyces sp. NPDC097619 TaxID=3157228 RepID=UPI003328E5B2
MAAALAMTAVLTAGGLWLYALLRANILDDTTGRTELAARKTSAQVDTGALRGPELPAPEGGVDLVLVLGPHGRVLASGGNLSAAAGFTELRPEPGADSGHRVLPPVRPGGERRAVVVVAARAPGGPAPAERYVYAMTVLGDADGATRAVGLGLLAGAPPLIAFAAALAWAVTGHALRPVTAIRAGLAAVPTEGLDRRVPDPGGSDEVARLARTVNATLDRLEEADARQRQFTADASHELRSPLAAVRARLEVALRDGDRDPDRESVAAALADTERLQRIAADLLLLARFDAGPAAGPGPRREPVDLALLAAEDAARRPGPRVPVRVEAAAPVPAHGDPAQLERLVANLVDNALRHARTGVVVSARGGVGEAVLEVSDDGPGIPEADRERVFERFVRLDADRGRARGGTGLGLAIARETARAHGGTLTAEGAPGGGARFLLRIPAGTAGPAGRAGRS